MAYEIEHKYLVNSSEYKQMAVSRHEIKQGYLSDNPESVVRVRVVDETGYFTVKGKTFSHETSKGKCDVRKEFEYTIPKEEAEEMLSLCKKGYISKTRYKIPYDGFIWEVDEFHRQHKGLILAEIELKSPDIIYPLPPFIGEEVTGDPKYYNSNL